MVRRGGGREGVLRGVGGSEVRHQRDALEDEKADINKDKLRQVKENERW